MHWYRALTLFYYLFHQVLGQVSLIRNENDNYAVEHCVRGIDERHTRHSEPGSASSMLFI
jgi:hypothetical protein